MTFKLSHSSIEESAGYFFVHAGHRETAVDLGIDAIKRAGQEAQASVAGDPVMEAFQAPLVPWVIESLIQGAWLREYQEWEKATKSYFEGQLRRNNQPKPTWKGHIPGLGKPSASHVDFVKLQLTAFGISLPPEILDTIDTQRLSINAAKHDEEYFVTEQDYRALVEAIADFWNELAKADGYLPMSP